MKKISLLLLFICCLLLTGCNSKETKEVKTLDDFQVSCNDNGFIVNNNIGNYSTVDYIKGSYIANLDEVTIEMVEYDSEENAEKAQDNQIKVFTNMKGSGAIIEKDKGANYYKHTMISNGYYMISTRVDNTLIFTKVTVDYKEKIDNIINALGY